jgi:hypothetical protein
MTDAQWDLLTLALGVVAVGSIMWCITYVLYGSDKDNWT